MNSARNGYQDIVASAAGVSTALRERDQATHDHCDRVAGLALELGRHCGLSEEELRILRLVAGFHDIGKIGIPDDVLRKIGRYSDADRQIMQAHAEMGQRIIIAAGLEHGETIADAVRHHHERVDGRGYPDGLTGDLIPIYSRIVAVADTYDAMAQLRTYRPPQTHRAIMHELRQVQGMQLDRLLVAKFAQVIEMSRYRVE
jgi:HD-GYP domain-containing protein (c-di-GMP phosphodiesterase class II)